MWEWELLNMSKPIWLRQPSEVTDAEYTAFYKTLSKVPLLCGRQCVSEQKGGRVPSVSAESSALVRWRDTALHRSSDRCPVLSYACSRVAWLFAL